MKYVKSCLIITMFVGVGYGCLGDMNCDSQYNILDIVSLSSCVLQATCSQYDHICGGCDVADVNGDSFYNVIDIVELANCVLAQNCGWQ